MNDHSQFEEQINLKYLTFTISRRTYAADVSIIDEISPACEVSPIPEFPEYIMGIAEIKGENIPIINPHVRFKDVDKKPDDPQKCFIVTDSQDMLTGLLVDKIGELVEVNPDYISPPPKVNSQAYTRYIQGTFSMNGSLVFILNIPLMINDEDLPALTNEVTEKNKQQ